MKINRRFLAGCKEFSTACLLTTALLLATEDEDNATILRDLFEGTGIMSAIDHSKIESANDPETRAIDYEASRIARQAAEALRQSRRVSPSHASHHSSLA